MTEAEYVFNQDIREKKSIKNSARSTNRTGKGPVRFPSDYLSTKEKKLNGPTVTMNQHQFYTYEEFKSFTPWLQVEWLNSMIKTYDVGISVINRIVFGNRSNCLDTYLRKHGISDQVIKTHKGRVAKVKLERLEKDVAEWWENHMKKDKVTAIEPANTHCDPDISETYTPPIVSEDLLEKKAETKTTLDHISFEMNGLDYSFLQKVYEMFGDKRIRCSVTIDVLEG